MSAPPRRRIAPRSTLAALLAVAVLAATFGVVTTSAVPESARAASDPRRDTARDGAVPLRDRWSPADVATLASMRLSEARPRPSDPSNAYEARADAAALGRTLFEDPRFSRNGRVACATCHAAGLQFQDGRPLGQGIATGTRRTMPVPGASHTPFLFWDGRKDSLWSQALGPLEDAAEHGGNRLRLVKLLAARYREPYTKVFGALPMLEALPDDASPNGTEAERAAWSALPDATRDDVDRAFANFGKAIAAYERGLAYGESRFDAYARATLAGDGRGQGALSAREVRGLRLFLGQGQCVTCHQGPLFSDQSFHNTGVPPRDANAPDRGRAEGIEKLVRDEFNCLGRYSDARPEECDELRYLKTGDPGHLGAFRTPSLRNVADRAPYMHAGQFATLEAVAQHYARSPKAAIGESELVRPGERRKDREGREPIRLSARDVGDLAAFLGALSGPVQQAR
jgi:cytochrome c peroxidase